MTGWGILAVFQPGNDCSVWFFETSSVRHGDRNRLSADCAATLEVLVVEWTLLSIGRQLKYCVGWAEHSHHCGGQLGNEATTTLFDHEQSGRVVSPRRLAHCSRSEEWADCARPSSVMTGNASRHRVWSPFSTKNGSSVEAHLCIRCASTLDPHSNGGKCVETTTERRGNGAHGIFQAVCDSSVFSGLLMPAWVGGPAAMGLVWNRSGCAQ